MFALIAKFKIKKGKEKDAISLFHGLIENVRRNETDTLIYDMHVSMNDSSEIMMYERYKNRDAWAVTHDSQPYVKALLADLAEYLDGEFELAEYELLETLH